MHDTFDYIESYFTGRCTDAEKQQFEDRIVQDQPFAEEVAFYIQSRQLLKEELLNQKRTAWSPTSPRRIAGPKRRPRPLRIVYFGSVAAAAAVLVVLSVYLLVRPAGPQNLAADYIRTHYDHLSQTLDGSRDSLQQGITAYNKRSFSHALAIFAALAKDHPDNPEALRYSGLVYLRMRDYDQALHQFEALAKIPSLYSNPGTFLKAVTLLTRNSPGDRESARQLL
ncbi:MAG TPA: hypothetical protein VG605_12305, partial [Puia sp.]|nr:hypothetical protein [Puia sp.]